ncbi:hypothetical protein BKA70DRAFT_1256930 [Coprinopsis sp. MPI-PUGE-AT-0042]|nr:hypothetical protein BKA70DRAFT_1256930 [Coprinopsis sp. MPI-PUGE-AT-0042]
MASKDDQDQGRHYHTECTGDALGTVQSHQADQDITLFGSCFCPFVQRAWATFEALQIPYKPKELVELSPKGLVPALRLNSFSPPKALNESTIIMEYLEDVAAGTTKQTVLPLSSNPYARALVRLAADQVNRNFIPAFYRYLQAQEESAQVKHGKEFHDAIQSFVGTLERLERDILSSGGASGEGELASLKKGLGLWVEGNTELGWADIMAAPWKRFNTYIQKIFNHPNFKATCSTEQLYLDSYERYAFNRPNTSMVATAINEGRALP